MKRDIAPGRTVYKQYEAKAESAGNRRIRFTVTTATPDRENDVVQTAGIDTSAYERNPVVLFAHDHRSLPIARCVGIDRTSDKLVATAEFATEADGNPFAEQVYRMVKSGFLNACSIGFRPLQWAYNEERGGVDFAASEMLEFSV